MPFEMFSRRLVANKLQNKAIKYINERAKMALYRSPDYQKSFESTGLSVKA